MKIVKEYDKIATKDGFLLCPVCGKHKVQRIVPETEAKNLVVYCRHCRQESVVNICKTPEPLSLS